MSDSRNNKKEEEKENELQKYNFLGSVLDVSLAACDVTKCCQLQKIFQKRRKILLDIPENHS